MKRYLWWKIVCEPCNQGLGYKYVLYTWEGHKIFKWLYFNHFVDLELIYREEDEEVKLKQLKNVLNNLIKTRAKHGVIIESGEVEL